MSSILDALREIEGNKASTERSRAAWAAGTAEERTPLGRAAEVLGVVAFGLALGGAGFALVLWLGGTSDPAAVKTTPAPAAAPARAAVSTAAAPPAVAPQTLVPKPAAPSAPAWLARMGAPRGIVAEGDDLRTDSRAEEPTTHAAGLSLVGLRYAESRGARTATLRIDGNPVILHEGDSAYGIELQLVTPAGAYVRRGGEVLMLEPSR